MPALPDHYSRPAPEMPTDQVFGANGTICIAVRQRSRYYGPMLNDRVRQGLEAAGINAASLDRIRLARGVVGKASYVAGVAILALGVIAWQLHDPALLIADAVLVILLFGMYFCGALWFANKHPGVALLEGAELIQWRQLDIAASDAPAHPNIEMSEAPPVIEELPNE